MHQVTEIELIDMEPITVPVFMGTVQAPLRLQVRIGLKSTIQNEGASWQLKRVMADNA